MRNVEHDAALPARSEAARLLCRTRSRMQSRGQCACESPEFVLLDSLAMYAHSCVRSPEAPLCALRLRMRRSSTEPQVVFCGAA
eukprot:7786319-Lingulodinium_polyedra.AAC.1